MKFPLAISGSAAQTPEGTDDSCLWRGNGYRKILRISFLPLLYLRAQEY